MRMFVADLTAGDLRAIGQCDAMQAWPGREGRCRKRNA